VIADAPEFSMPAYVVYPLEYDRDLFGSALEIMHRMASPQTKTATGKRAAKPAAQKGR
jgi:LysR family transcriptional regulator, flagellar master operon regulator